MFELIDYLGGLGAFLAFICGEDGDLNQSFDLAGLGIDKRGQADEHQGIILHLALQLCLLHFTTDQQCREC